MVHSSLSKEDNTFVPSIKNINVYTLQIDIVPVNDLTCKSIASQTVMPFQS